MHSLRCIGTINNINGCAQRCMVSMHIFFLSHMSYTISFVVFLEVIPFMLFQVNDNNRHRENDQMAFIYIVFSKELFSLKEFHILSNVGVLIYITTKYFLLHICGHTPC